jgi:hypothetical protein
MTTSLKTIYCLSLYVEVKDCIKIGTDVKVTAAGRDRELKTKRGTANTLKANPTAP